MTRGSEWMDQALCVGRDPDIWFVQARRTEAMRICAACPVASQCRASWPDAYRGVWGGEVRRMKNPGPSPTAEYLGFEHGTERGYRKHFAMGQTPCDRCNLAYLYASREREERRAEAVSA